MNKAPVFTNFLKSALLSQTARWQQVAKNQGGETLGPWLPAMQPNDAIDAFIEAMGRSFASPMPGDPLAFVDFSKSTFVQAGSATTGLTYYDLELGAKFLYPVLTPLRNEIPRTSGKGGIQANWRAVTGINTTGIRGAVSPGNRNAYQVISTQDYTAAYKGFGGETSVQFEAQYAGAGFDDIRAIAAKVGLEQVMLSEEYEILGGNASIPLGQAAAPTVSPLTSGGSLVDATYSVIVAPLAFDGVFYGSVAGGVQGVITRSNAGNSSDTFGGGTGKLSNNTTAVVTGGGGAGSLTATVPVVNGAVGYAWFWGTSGSEVLGAITTINSIAILANATGTQTAASLGTGDNSQNTLEFDGLLTQAFKPGSNAYVAVQPTGTAGVGTPLTADGEGGVSEIDALLKDRWDNYRLSPDTMWVNSQEALNISRKILQGGTNAAQRFVIATDQANVRGGIMARSYLNKFSMAGPKDVEIRLHPNMPAGTILFTSRTLPYPLSGVPTVMQMRMRQDYYQIQWPLTTREWQYGVYADGVLQHYFPPSMGVITNIGNG
jgi:hypothetical protein